MTAKHNRHFWLVIVASVLATLVACNSNPVGASANNEVKTYTVKIKQFRFVPEVLEVKAGDKVIWVNQDIVPHTATALDKSWDTGEIASEESKEMIVTKTQSLSYYCFYHPIMKAKLVLNQ